MKQENDKNWDDDEIGGGHKSGYCCQISNLVIFDFCMLDDFALKIQILRKVQIAK